MFHISEVKIDRIVLVKAFGICALGWLAVPLIYVLLKKKEKEIVKKEDDRHSDKSGNNGDIDIHSN